MDPTAAELAAIAGVDDACLWVGIEPPLLAAMREAIGDFKLLREVVLIPDAAWNDAVAAMRVRLPAAAPRLPSGSGGADAEAVAAEAAAGGAQSPPPSRALRPLELGQVGSLRRVARLRLGLPATEESGGAAALVDAGGAPSASALAATTTLAVRTAPGERKLKMATLFDQADDSELAPWTAARARAVLAAFVAGNDGEEPERAEEASADQLAALEHRLLGGGAPCPDFAVWRPFGHRLVRRLRLTVHHREADGSYKPHEVAGPPSFEEWLAAWRVFATAMRALQAASAAKLAMYESRIRRFHDSFGPRCWWIVAQADQRMRGEQWERLRRRAEVDQAAAVAEGRPHPFNPQMPWDHVLKLASSDSDFWAEELQ